MFTFLVRFWLVSVSTGLVLLALQSAYLYIRDGRRERRLLAAHFYAQLIVQDRVHKGEFDGRPVTDVNEAYEFEKIAYLNS